LEENKQTSISLHAIKQNTRKLEVLVCEYYGPKWNNNGKFLNDYDMLYQGIGVGLQQSGRSVIKELCAKKLIIEP